MRAGADAGTRTGSRREQARPPGHRGGVGAHWRTHEEEGHGQGPQDEQQPPHALPQARVDQQHRLRTCASGGGSAKGHHACASEQGTQLRGKPPPSGGRGWGTGGWFLPRVRIHGNSPPPGQASNNLRWQRHDAPAITRGDRRVPSLARSGRWASQKAQQNAS
jgi:hypothetical protein